MNAYKAFIPQEVATWATACVLVLISFISGSLGNTSSTVMLVARFAIAGIGPAITYATAVVALVFATFLNSRELQPDRSNTNSKLLLHTLSPLIKLCHKEVAKVFNLVQYRYF
jgi:hypothetical protein